MSICGVSYPKSRRCEVKARKRIIKRWIRDHKIDTCIPPKVRIVCSYRDHGLSTQFGEYHKRYMNANGLMWTDEGKPTELAQKYYAGYSGWTRTIEDWEYLWRYIRICYVDGAIHKMDYV